MSLTQQISTDIFQKLDNMALFLMITTKPDDYTQIVLKHSDSIDDHFEILKTYPNVAVVCSSEKAFLYIPSDVDIKKYIKIVKSENVPIIFEIEFN